MVTRSFAACFAVVLCVSGLSLAGASQASGAVSAFMSSLNDLQLDDIEIELVPGDHTTPADRAQLQRIEELWNSGDRGQALAAILAVEATDDELTLEFSSRTPIPAVTLNGVQVGANEDCSGFRLDSHTATGNLFAVSQGMWGSTEGVFVHISTDGGASWLMTAGSMGDIASSASVVLGDYLYLAIVGTERARVSVTRFAATDGARDTVYDYHIPLTTTGEFEEVSLAGTADWDNQRLYIMAIEADGTLRYTWTDAAGLVWSEVATEVSNADHSLDVSANRASAGCGIGLLATFVATDGYIWVWRRSTAGDSLADNLLVSYREDGPPKIAAWDDSVFLTFVRPTLSGYSKACCMHSVDGAASWQNGPCFGAENTYHSRPDVTMRRGAGTALVFQAEEASDDVLYLTQAPLGTTGNWSADLRCNENDLVWGADSTVERLATGGWGVLTTVGSTNALYFDLAPLIIRDGFESGGTGAWSAVLP